MDVNNSVLQLLPQGWGYDFEGPTHGPLDPAGLLER